MTNDDEEEIESGIDPLAQLLPPPPMTPSGGGNGENAGQQLPPPPPPLTPSGGGNGGNASSTQLPPPPPPTTPTSNVDEENTSSGDFVGENITSVGENTSAGIFVGTNNIPVVKNTSTGGGSLSISVVTPSNYHRCNQTEVNNNTESDSVVAKEEERSALTVQQSSNGKRKDVSITSNVHLLQEELEENTEERKHNEPSIELHDHDGTKSPQSSSSKWTKTYLQNGDVVHATTKQEQHHQYQNLMPRPNFSMNKDSPSNQNSFIINHIAKFQKIVAYASHRLQEETLGLQEEPSVIEINNLHLLQEELHAPITINNL